MIKIIKYLNKFGLFNILPDKLFIRFYFRLLFNKKIDLNDPKSFSEKLQWIKLYDRKKIYTEMVDKYKMKNFVDNIIGKGYTFKTLKVVKNFNEIDFDKLPNQFVIKTTHDSGGVIVCTNKENFDTKKAKRILTKHLKKNFYYINREYPYKNVLPKIMIEEYMGNNLTDYRVYCFNGQAKYIYEYLNANEGIEKPEPINCNIYDTNWIQQKFRNAYFPTKNKSSKPLNFQKMIKISELLSRDTKFLRVDFYIINCKLYVGELTFFPGGGFSKFYPESADYKLGKMIKL